MSTFSVFKISFCLFVLFGFLQVQAQTHKGIAFQGVIKLPGGELPNKTGITVNARLLSPNDCILREEQFSGVNITNGYININIGTGSTGGHDPGLTLKQLMDNSAAIGGLTCLNADGTINATTSFNPATSNGARKFRMSLTIDSTPVVADFNMRSMAFAINSETLDGKAKTDFVNINAGSGLTQSNAESVFNRFTKLDAILNNFNAGGTGLSANVSGTAANVTGVVAIANGGTGGATAAAAKTNLGLAAIASSGSASDLTTGTVPTARLGTGTADNTTYLRGDGTWSIVAAASGDITDVTAGTGLTGGGTSGAVTLNLSSVGTAGDYYKVTTDAQGRVTAGQAALVAADIPALPTSKITTGTFADAMLAGLSIDKLINASTKYFNYKPNNVACANNEVLKYDSTLNSSAGGWKCAPDSGVGSETDPSVAAYAKNTPGNGLTVNGSNVLEVDTGVVAGKVVKLETGAKLPAVDGSQLTNLPGAVNFSGSLTGDVTGTQGATVVGKLNGIGVSTAVAGDDLKFMKYVHGSGWQPHFVKLSELRNSTGASSAFNVGSCTAAQTLVWSSITDQFACQAINGIPVANITGLGGLATKSAVDLSTSEVTATLPIAHGGTGATSTSQGFVFAGPASGGAGAPAFRAIASSDLPASASYWSAATGGINYSGGNVGINVAAPVAKFDIAGALKIGDEGLTCSGATLGVIRKNSATSGLEKCNGTYWIGLANEQSVPPSTSVLMSSCGTGWTDTGTTGGGPGGSGCGSVPCHYCQSPSTYAAIPASSVMVMDSCPANWTNLGTAPAGPSVAWAGILMASCQSPAQDSALPAGARILAEACPSPWIDLGVTGGGPGTSTCSGGPCRVCQTPGSTSKVRTVAGDSGGTTLQGGDVSLIAGDGGTTSGTGGAVTIRSGSTVDGASGNVLISVGTTNSSTSTARNGGFVDISSGIGVSNGNGGNVLITAKNGNGTGTNGNIILNYNVNGFVGIGTNAPETKLRVDGAITGTVGTFNSVLTCGSSSVSFAATNFLNFSPSNTVAAGTCVVTLTGMVAGGSYTMVVSGGGATNAITYDFAGYTFKYLPTNAATTAGKDTIYTFLYSGSVVYVTWASGY